MSWAEIYPWRGPQAGEPVIRQIYDQVRGAIVQSALKPGDRLPSSRDFAQRLGVARASVVAAYDLLLAEGYAVGRPGSGTYVSTDLSGVAELKPPADAAPRSPSVVPDRVRDLDEVVLPPPQADQRLFTSGRTLLDARAMDAWSRSTRRALRTLDPVHFGYSDPRGDKALRRRSATTCEPPAG